MSTEIDQDLSAQLHKLYLFLMTVIAQLQIYDGVNYITMQ